MPEGKNKHKQNRKIKWLSSNESMGVLDSHPGVERFCLQWHWSAWQLFLWLPPPIYRWPNNVRPYPKCIQQYLNSHQNTYSRLHFVVSLLTSPGLTDGSFTVTKYAGILWPHHNCREMHQSLIPKKCYYTHTVTPADNIWAEIEGSPDVVHPVEPGFEVVIRDDLELSISDDICSLLSHLSAVHVPLRLQQRLHYVLRTAEKHTYAHQSLYAC